MSIILNSLTFKKKTRFGIPDKLTFSECKTFDVFGLILVIMPYLVNFAFLLNFVGEI